MERFMKQMMAKTGGNTPKISNVEQNDNSNDMEGQLQVGLNLSNPMEKPHAGTLLPVNFSTILS